MAAQLFVFTASVFAGIVALASGSACSYPNHVPCWGYSDTGVGGSNYKTPPYWHSLSAEYADCDADTFHSQSPIDISSHITTSTSHHRRSSSASTPAVDATPSGETVAGTHGYAALQFTGVDDIQGRRVKNTGHALQVDVGKIDGHYATVKGGHMEATYNIQQLQFHWGTNDTTGSEHTLDGKQSPLEMHIVTSHSEINPDFEADKDSGTKATSVVGVFFEIGAANLQLQKLINNIGTGKVLLAGSEVELKDTILDISGFFPKEWKPESGPYYYYDGSLTTPPCFQSVAWHIVAKKATVSVEQMQTIRTLSRNTTDASDVIGFNYRPLQPRMNRQVHYFTPVLSEHEADECHTPYMAAFVFMTFLCLCCTCVFGNAFLEDVKGADGHGSESSKEGDETGVPHVKLEEGVSQSSEHVGVAAPLT